MKTLKWIYKILRSVIFSVIIAIVALFVVAYIVLAIPPVHNLIKNNIEKEASEFLGTEVKVGSLSIFPLNEVVIEDSQIFDMDQRELLKIGRLGAEINLWRLLFKGRIEITYVELLDFKTEIYQKKEGGPTNIDFIIQAFQKKDNEQPPAKFDVDIKNIVIRNGIVSFSKLWKKENKNGTFDPNHILIRNLSADVKIPRISNDETEIDLRRLSFSEKSGLQVKNLSGIFNIVEDRAQITNFSLRLPETILKLEDFTLPFVLLDDNGNSAEVIKLNITDSKITPSNFSFIIPELSGIDIPFYLNGDINGNLHKIEVSSLSLTDKNNLALELQGNIYDIKNKDNLILDLEALKVSLKPSIFNTINNLLPQYSKKAVINEMIDELGSIEIKVVGKYAFNSGILETNLAVASELGEFQLSSSGYLKNATLNSSINIEIPRLAIPSSIENLPVHEISETKIEFTGDIDFNKFGINRGNLAIQIGEVNIKGRNFKSISGIISKEGTSYSSALSIDDSFIDGRLEARALLNGEESELEAILELNKFDTFNSLISSEENKALNLQGKATLQIKGNNIDNINGSATFSNIQIKKFDNKELRIEDLSIDIKNQNESNSTSIKSDLFDMELTGNYKMSLLPGLFKRTLGEVCPSLFLPYEANADCGNGILNLTIGNTDKLSEFFNIPFVPLSDIQISGSFDSKNDIIRLGSSLPAILQGEKNLITDTFIDILLEGRVGESEIKAGTVYPTKKGLLGIDLEINGNEGLYDLHLGMNKNRDSQFEGDIDMNIYLQRYEGNKLLVIGNLFTSMLLINGTPWQLENAEIVYSPQQLKLDGFCVHHDDQFVRIDGYNDKDGNGTINLNLSKINLDYLFETLNIPHVTFGGEASGRILARHLISGNPEVNTDNLRITDMSYNGAIIGDGDVYGELNMKEKMIKILASIKENHNIVADVDGGVWFGRDSLSFNFMADSVNVAFMQPFMKAFSSRITGKASGEAHLFGTFSDIDMTGKIVAHDVKVHIDYINADYMGGDTVYLYPGKIIIPAFKVMDDYGHVATVNGELSHDFFHDPVFRFRINDMDNLLVYNTSSSFNNLWYGKIFVSGAGEISGKPGSVRIAADVRTEPNSDFTFVLTDKQEAVKSHFLTFSDHRKKEREIQDKINEREDPRGKFLQANTGEEEEVSDIFTMDFRVSVNDGIAFNLIMDPVAGDKIKAYGNGAMTLTYSSLTDELRIYGKYVLDKGVYNFSLQDIILKEFIIKPGSSISFTGNPYTGNLDITAAYRVNTSLTELDRSFANDRDLNRTSVPVEALLKVTGVLTSPSIDFDIELPTVTEETARKVRSIISTDDMMSRQVLYLVALNKFYPPEYMSTSNSGGEWASIASSTLSSQIQNMIGQLTDKFTLAPSIRTDKGDFSDIEFDVALSSQLFNNRLLLNGNLGYRDPSNSSTTFVGDFDLEYLLNKKGTWRLKAYNHFNDQNYYLKSALTTQGLGIVWRKDFGKPTIIKSNGRKEEPITEEKED